MVPKIHYQQLDQFLMVTNSHVHFDNLCDASISICGAISIVVGNQEQ